ncbi:MAG: germination protein YpeB [Firmicutes bacterium]|nr:germination protein YpeB [Bacillota bacterium]
MAGRKATALALALLLFIGGGWWIWRSQNRMRAAEYALEANYQRAFFDMMENMENLDNLLGKSLASNSRGQRIMTLTGIWHEAERARGNLGNLPLGMVNMMRSQQYLAQLGDYCQVLAKMQARDLDMDEEEWQQLCRFHQQTRDIQEGLREMMTGIKEEGFEWRSFAALRGDQRLTPAGQSLADGFGRIDEGLRDRVPTLTYDGPFSDHLEEREPMVALGEKVTEGQAREKALDFLGLRDGTGYRIEKTAKTRGRIPAYSIVVQEEKDAPPIALDISQQGGHVLWMLSSRIPQEASLSQAQAVARGKAFLEKQGYKNMVTTASIVEGNQLAVSFAHREKGVIIYPDLVKVTVALDDGAIVAFDAMGYLMCHHRRELPAPKLKPEEAEKMVCRQLEIQQTRLAVIPLGTLEERFCYEVRGKVNGDTYLVYINAVTGEEEELLQLLETEAGTRTL